MAYGPDIKPGTGTEPTAKAIYQKLQTDRDSYVWEAYESALLTIPAVMPEQVDALHRANRPMQKLQKPWQSLGARGVNNLAAKLLLALLPPTGSFFRYEIDPASYRGIPKDRVDKFKTDLEQRLAARERTVMSAVNGPIRTKVFLAIKHMIVTGNVLIYLPPDEIDARVFPLNQYVVRRDFLGNVLELVYVEILDRDSVSPEVAAILDTDPEYGHQSDKDKRSVKPVELYTKVCRVGKRFEYYQEVCGKEIPGKRGSVKIEDSHWLILRWTAIDGEDYGRGFVEEYRGDLRSLEELSKALVKAALNAAKLVPLISPSATITPRRLVNAENGEPIVANHDDVLFLQQQKHADMTVARAQKQDLEQALAADFLMNASFQRQAERVTAEEIRIMAQELEDSLGGVYSIQSQELQLPLAKRIEANLVRKKTLDPMSKDVVKTVVVTGLAAIGRGQDLQRLQEGMAMVTNIAGLLPAAIEYINTGDLVKRIFVGVGVDTDGLLRSEEEAQAAIQQKQAQAEQAASAKALGPHAIKAINEQTLQSRQITADMALAQAGTAASPSSQPTE